MNEQKLNEKIFKGLEDKSNFANSIKELTSLFFSLACLGISINLTNSISKKLKN